MAAYDLKSVVQIAQAPGVWVREFTFAPGEGTPWHRHSQMSDRVYGLAGAITVEREGAPPFVLGPGAVIEIPPGTLHRLVNAAAEDAVTLLVQSGGRYDFLEPPA